MDSGQADAEYIEIIKEQDRRAAQRSFLHYYMRMTGFIDRKSTRLNSSHLTGSRMPSSA